MLSEVVEKIGKNNDWKFDELQQKNMSEKKKQYDRNQRVVEIITSIWWMSSLIFIICLKTIYFVSIRYILIFF